MRRTIKTVCAIVALAMSSPVFAEARSLGVPNDKGWQHAQTGIILMSKLGDFQRAELKDYGTDEVDVSATYYAGSNANTATVYLYRPGLTSLPVWFDRSHFAMVNNQKIVVGEPATPITRFAPAGSTVESALRVTYTLKGAERGGTGLVMVPFGEWLLAIRLTSQTMTPAEVDATLVDLVKQVRWPTQRPADEIAIPVGPCTRTIKIKKAKLLKPDMAQALIGATLNSMVDDKDIKPVKSSKPVTFCRLGGEKEGYSVYLSDQVDDGYFLGLGDAGISASVFPGLSLMTDRKEYAVTLLTGSTRETYPSFNALPEPGQVFALVTTQGPMSSVKRGTKDINIVVK